jgi:osmoprotectant transport system permease protein
LSDTAEEKALALVGTTLGEGYRLEALIGQGSMGAVYRAQSVTGAAVAVKTLSSEVIGQETSQRFLRESELVRRLKAAGLSASSREGLGSNVIFEALASNDIDLYVDYSGTLWANQFQRNDIRPRQEVLTELKTMLARQNITLLGELGFENAYALVMPRKRAEQLGIRSITDLAPRAVGLSIAADYEFFSRPEWAGLKRAYGLSFRAQRQMQPDFMYAAVASGEVDVIAGYTSDGLIAKYDLVVLNDPKRAIPPYDAMVLLAPRRAGDEALRAALQPLLGKIDIATMREANLRAAGNDANSSPDAVAKWLWEKVGGW